MALSRQSGDPDTYFAPAARAQMDELRAAREQFLTSRVAVKMLNAVPDPTMVLTSTRQIIIANQALMGLVGMGDDEMIGPRPGELFECVHSGEMSAGCGTSKACALCGAGQAIVECIESGSDATRECRVRRKTSDDGGALDIRVHATSMDVSGTQFVMAYLRDISAERRRQVLERVFFRHVLDTAFGVRTTANLIRNYQGTAGGDQELRDSMCVLSTQVFDELVAQRQLLAAERGELELNVMKVRVTDLLDDVVATCRHQETIREHTIELGMVPQCAVETDPVLLRRVIGNLVTNALEATHDDGAVTLTCREAPESVCFAVTNPGVIPEDVQQQIYQRSFSTKDELGRGLGTYSAKLFTERYLSGTVAFTSTEPEGTVFSVTIPKTHPQP